MNGRKAKQARRSQHASAAPPATRSGSSFWRSWRGAAAGALAVAVVAGTFVVPGLLGDDASSPAAVHAAMGADHGKGLPAGSPVPAFAERDVVDGKPITAQTLYGGKTLLFFSEGVMCQACFEQIKGIEEVGDRLAKRGIRLVSITPDTRDDLTRMIASYDIRTPMIADDDRSMSAAFNTLGLGMHADTPGHAFALIDHGTVVWYRDYWLPPDRSMYVEPDKLLAEIPSA